MKISVVTPTYNREKLLKNLYNSLIENSKYDVEIEWDIMDDGSTDNTKELIQNYINEGKIEIKYFYQKNQGKMKALNKLIPEAQGDLIIECDSDDYFTSNAFEIIKREYEKNTDKNIYALCFLKIEPNGKNMGETFKKTKTTMFDLYFKEKENGEKALVFYSRIRKIYKHKLEKNERFVTEARMYHEMDLKYNILCINEPIMVCEYQNTGYSKNISKQFAENPFGYYEYFKEILQRDMRGVSFNKKLYAIKHYILFSYLTKQYKLKPIKNFDCKFLFIILFIPGILKSKFVTLQFSKKS